MGIQQLYNDNLRKLPNEYGDVSVMGVFLFKISPQGSLNDTIGNRYTVEDVQKVPQS